MWVRGRNARTEIGSARRAASLIFHRASSGYVRRFTRTRGPVTGPAFARTLSDCTAFQDCEDVAEEEKPAAKAKKTRGK